MSDKTCSYLFLDFNGRDGEDCSAPATTEYGGAPFCAEHWPGTPEDSEIHRLRGELADALARAESAEAEAEKLRRKIQGLRDRSQKGREKANGHLTGVVLAADEIRAERDRLRTALKDAAKLADGLYEDCHDVGCAIGEHGGAKLRDFLRAVMAVKG